MRPFAIWLETTRSADAPGTRKVALPVRRLHEASPTGPGSHGSEPFAAVAMSSPRQSYVARGKRNARIAPIFRHHPGIGGHQTPLYVPIPGFTPPGAL